MAFAGVAIVPAINPAAATAAPKIKGYFRINFSRGPFQGKTVLPSDLPAAAELVKRLSKMRASDDTTPKPADINGKRRCSETADCQKHRQGDCASRCHMRWVCQVDPENPLDDPKHICYIIVNISIDSRARCGDTGRVFG